MIQAQSRQCVNRVAEADGAAAHLVYRSEIHRDVARDSEVPMQREPDAPLAFISGDVADFVRQGAAFARPDSR